MFEAIRLQAAHEGFRQRELAGNGAYGIRRAVDEAIRQEYDLLGERRESLQCIEERRGHGISAPLRCFCWGKEHLAQSRPVRMDKACFVQSESANRGEATQGPAGPEPCTKKEARCGSITPKGTRLAKRPRASAFRHRGKHERSHQSVGCAPGANGAMLTLRRDSRPHHANKKSPAPFRHRAPRLTRCANRTALS